MSSRLALYGTCALILAALAAACSSAVVGQQRDGG